MIDPAYAEIWERAEPFLRIRANDRHTIYCYHFAEALVGLHAEARAEVVLPAILLHDVGWSTVPEDRILESFGPRTRYPELRRQHEVEGARIARDVLEACRYPARLVDDVATIIDGHDTRESARSLDDALVRDADKLWRYTPFGLETVAAWFGHDRDEQLALLDAWCASRFFTSAGRHMARGLLVALRLQAVGDAAGSPSRPAAR